MPKVDLLTGERRHRRWSADEKEAIVEAALAPGSRPSVIAKRADISTGQLYSWRKELHKAGLKSFAPVLTLPERSPSKPETPAPAIEIEIHGHRVRIPSSMLPELAKAWVRHWCSDDPG